jgi:pantetheine-phosphate adenylyltransferase
MKERIAVYPGTFDPITYGHVDVVGRAAKMFPRVVILIARNSSKMPLFSDDERVTMVRDVFRGMRRVSVESFDGLLVDYVMRNGPAVIVRGLRAVSDFEYEFQMALTNRKLAPTIDTVFLVPDEKYTYLNSTIVREVARLGGNVADFVPPLVRRRLLAKLGL